jgi:flagellar L-ring protein precursor FlgH
MKWLPPLLIVLISSTSARADSIWLRGAPQSSFLFNDNRARHVGDLLTVVIVENTGIGNDEERNMQKDTATNGTFNFKGDMAGVTSRSASADFNAGTTSQRLFDGKSKFTSTRQFTDSMTVVVTEVMANGNLVVAGQRKRMLHGEERILRLTGVVRPNDIGAGNTVLSQFIANFQVVYEGRGYESHFIAPGWLERIMNYAWPF